MGWIFVAVGFTSAYLGTTGLLVALIHHIPYSRLLARTPEPAVVQRIDGKLDVWYGPVPYGRILLCPFILTCAFIAAWVAVAAFLPAYHLPFAAGAGIAVPLILLGLPDPKGRFRRSFRRTFGDNYMSNVQADDVITIQDEEMARIEGSIATAHQQSPTRSDRTPGDRQSLLRVSYADKPTSAAEPSIAELARRVAIEKGLIAAPAESTDDDASTLTPPPPASGADT